MRRVPAGPAVAGAGRACVHWSVWQGGNNSVVECDLAKVEVAGSNPVSRSNFNPGALAPGPPTRALARRFVASLRSRGALALARALRARGLWPPDPRHALSLGASSPRSVRVARSPRSRASSSGLWPPNALSLGASRLAPFASRSRSLARELGSPPDPRHALSLGASSPRSVRVARSRSLARFELGGSGPRTPDTRSRSALRRLAPFAWRARARSRASARGLWPPDPRHALSLGASSPRSVRVARSRSLARFVAWQSPIASAPSSIADRYRRASDLRDPKPPRV